MHIKSSHAEDNASKGISGVTRKHIISKLQKASRHADQLVSLLSDRSGSKASDNDYLEAKAYALSLSGSAEFEKQVTKRYENPQEQKAAWSKCLTQFSEAHVIYSALLFATQKDALREVISGAIDPSIRYAAYQSKLPRTIATSTVAKRTFRQDQTELVSLVKKLNPNVFNEEPVQKASSSENASSVSVPKSINWRNRTAAIADAAIGQALAATALAASSLSASFTSASEGPSSKHRNPRTLAAAYDPVLTSAQDAVDAVRRSITDLAKEGVPESDSRMQDLRVSDLAVNYGLISWRIGRNRVLISGLAQDDGMTFEPEAPHAPKKRKSKAKPKAADKEAASGESKQHIPKQESVPHRLARLTERTVLLDSTLQSIDSIKYLPGASRDAAFIGELDAQTAYFRAIKCLNIGYSHAILNHDAEALALFAHAQSLLDSGAPDSQTVSVAPTTTPGLHAAASAQAPPMLPVAPAALQKLRAHLKTEVLRQRGLVALRKHFEAQPVDTAPLVDRLETFPRSGKVDLNNLVTYPPRLEPVPVKPILLDLAWNYIDYPGRRTDDDTMGGMVETATAKVAEAANAVAGGAEKEKKKGWFGFGR